jgi:hypothetical protein
LLDAACKGQGGMLLKRQRVIERAVNDAHHRFRSGPHLEEFPDCSER